ncbi:MAG: imidazole glycerol phosphate synthase subunit HisH [Balneolaceae bacterium]|nr:imidazole glycerol phosphate synthase subunit HisH [Balneolaceae bacterium]
MIAIINYDAGNLASVSNALDRLQAEHIITKNMGELDKADAIIFPGVGHAKPAMESLQKNGLDDWIKNTTKPLLGICLGMQLLYESSQEGGGTKGLGLVSGQLKKFDNHKQKVPHMGWNTCSLTSAHPLLHGLDDRSYFYFVHSYYAPLNKATIASCNYGTDFTAMVAEGNIMGTQFHPEKSGDAGHQLLKNFFELTKRQIPVN